MSTSEASVLEWPQRDLRKTARVIITPLTDCAIIPNVSEGSDIGMEICNSYSFMVDPFWMIQVRMEILIKLPTGIIGRILSGAECSPLHEQPQTIPSH